MGKLWDQPGQTVARDWKGKRNRGGAQQLKKTPDGQKQNQHKGERHDGGHDGFFMYRVSVAIFAYFALAWIWRNPQVDQ